MNRKNFIPPFLLLAIVGLAALSACGDDDPIEKPTPPDLSELQRVYQSPGGNLNAETAREGLTHVAELVHLLETTNILAIFLEMLAGFGAAEDQKPGTAQTRQQPLSFQGDGYAVISRICRGWDPNQQNTPDQSNGRTELTINFTESGIDPVIWGEMRRCKFLQAESQIQLGDNQSGSFRVYVGEGLSLDNPANFTEGLLFSLTSPVTIDDSTQEVDTDFRVLPPSEEGDENLFEIRVPLTDGDLIMIVGSNGLISVRAANGTFTCNQGEGTCTSENGTTIFLP